MIRFDLKSGPEDERQAPEALCDSAVLDEYENPVPPKQDKQPREYAENEVTEEALSALLGRFARGELRRLELSWYGVKLVFAKEKAGYACLYFSCDYVFNGKNIWYSMVSRPEVYRTVEADEVDYVPFGMGKLPSYSLFGSATAILRDLDRILAQAGRERIDSEGPGEWLWACHPSLQNAHHKLLMVQQKLGGVPPRRGRNRLEAKFVMNKYPVELESLNLDGEQTLTEIRSGCYGQAADALALFMRRRLAKLRLSWEFKLAKGDVFRRHMVLLQDNGRFMMLWLQDDKERAEYYASEAKEQGTAIFLGQTVPAQAVHQELPRIRNCVDLILDDMNNTNPVTERPGEFVPTELVYHTIRAELVNDHI